MPRIVLKEHKMDDYEQIYAEIFSDIKCDNPECDCGGTDEVLFVHARCHVYKPVEVFLKSGFLHIRCSECHSGVIKVEVPPKEI
jgi:hypothetical protein